MKEFLADRKGAVALIVIVVLVVAVIVAAHVSAPERDRQEVELGGLGISDSGPSYNRGGVTEREIRVYVGNTQARVSDCLCKGWFLKRK